VICLELLAGFLTALSPARATEPPKIDWQPWTDQIFERARAEKKLVLLDLGTAWCHWCHVMDEQTYADPAVVGLLRTKYLAVRVDADSRPDLANRYEDYGWPATIIFKWDGSELAKRQGYLPPKAMAGMLEAFIEDPSPGPSVEPEPTITAASKAGLSPGQIAAAQKRIADAYDSVRGGWGEVHHYLNWNAIELCLLEGAAGDARMESMARQTLNAGVKLLDPVWGGVYQYSTDGDWDHPHFEKLMPFQSENMRVFALAGVLWNEPQWLERAETIHTYLREFLSAPEGAFYSSQDADLIQGEHGGEYFALDDTERRKRGIPRIDKHLYARENGLAVTGLCALYAANGNVDALAEARRAAEWVVSNRSIPGGGFRHDAHDASGPFLGDTLAMGRAFLALYTVTAERSWLSRAEQAALFISSHFPSGTGFATAWQTPDARFQSKPQVDENIMLVRFASLLYHHTGDDRFRAMAEHAMRYLAAPAVVESQGFGASGILLAGRALTIDPPHITIVGSRSDASAKALFATALHGGALTARIEWFDPREGPLPHADVEYPQMEEAAAFLCANGSCSAPVQTPAALFKHLEGLWKRRDHQ
jgi:uncharacterized protein YyaL (SSP411 family)